MRERGGGGVRELVFSRILLNQSIIEYINRIINQHVMISLNIHIQIFFMFLLDSPKDKYNILICTVKKQKVFNEGVSDDDLELIQFNSIQLNVELFG